MKKMNKMVLGLLFISSTIVLAACSKTKNVNESLSKESTESTVGESTTETTSVEYTTAADTSAEDTSAEDTSVEESPSSTAADNVDGTLDDANNDMPFSSDASERFTASLYATLKDEWSCSGYISAENTKTNVSVGGMDMESAENLWDYFMSLLEDWELTDVVGSLNDFTDYDGLLLISSGNENLYSDRAWIAANDQASVAIGYDDASFDSNRNLYHSGNYHDLIIRLDYDGYTYLFDFTK